MTVLRPMVHAEYAAWLEEAIPGYAADKVASGQWSQEAALELSRKGYDELLPQGLETPDNHFYTIADSESNAVGMLWYAVKTQFNTRAQALYAKLGFQPTNISLFKPVGKRHTA